jgi:hypothetical protein
MVFWSIYYETLLRLKAARAKQVTGGSTMDFSLLTPDEQNLLFLQAISGACGGMASAIVTNPLEVMRIRIQVENLSIRINLTIYFRCIGQITSKLLEEWLNLRACTCLRKDFRHD